MQHNARTAENEQKVQRLALIKERHRKIVLQPRYETDTKVADAMEDDLELDFDFDFDFN